MLALQPNLIPFLGVYLLPQNDMPDGDANAGMIRFTETAQIGISVVQTNNDQDALDQSIDSAFRYIKGRLWTDAGISNVLNSTNPEGARIESISRGTSRRVWGTFSTSNETPMCELEYIVSVVYRSEFWPDITDTLDEIDVTTGIKTTDTQAERDQRQQVTVKYMFTALRAALRSPSHG